MKSIRGKLGLILGAFFLIVLTATGATLYTISLQKGDAAVINIAGRQRMLTQKMAKEVLGITRRYGDGAVDDVEGLKEGLRKTAGLFDTSLRGLIKGDEELGLEPTTDPAILAQLQDVGRLWKAFRERIEVILTSEPDDPAYGKALDFITDNNVPLLNEMNRAVKMYETEASRKVSRLIWVLVAAVVLSMAAFGAGWLLVGRLITGPVGKVAEAAERMAEGDLMVTLDATSRDETGRMMESLNRMAGNLKRILTQTIEASQQVSTAADQIAGACQNFSQRISEQASSVEETSATMQEMSASIRQTAENAREANKLAQATKASADAGSRVMEDTIEAMDEINRSSSKIANISNVIEEIAFQTNLLALNAAVEAARAGEHGKGFAVVASEIRNLAQRASQSAKEITGLIEESVEKTERGVNLAHELNRKLEEIGTSVKKVTDLMDEVAAAAAEQSSGTNQVNTAISQIDQTTQQNASLVEESAASAEELAAQAKELLNLVSFFKIDGDHDRDQARHARGAEGAGRSLKRDDALPGGSEPVTTAATSLEDGDGGKTNGGFEEF